jgi:hypothetical protein
VGSAGAYQAAAKTPNFVSRGSGILSLKTVSTFFDGPFTDTKDEVNPSSQLLLFLDCVPLLPANANATTVNKAALQLA